MILGVNRIFLLSPAYSGGERAKMLLNPGAKFDLAQRVRMKQATLGETFSFLSGLYFRGKLAYAKTFERPPKQISGAWVITSNQGLMDAARLADVKLLESFAKVDIDEKEEKYWQPLLREGLKMRKKIGKTCEVVLLGSIATGKYVNLLLEVFGDQLMFPIDFVGRGDMSRGGLLLRCAADKTELSYVSVQGAVRRGSRPVKLAPRRYTNEDLMV